MKTKDGDYWCLEKSGGHIHTESHCPKDFKSTNKHKFHSIKNGDDSNVPSDKCGIQSVFDDSFIRTKDNQMEAGTSKSPNGDVYHFKVNEVGNGKFTIVGVKMNKFVKQDGHHAKVVEDSDCGESCHFIIEEIDSEGICYIRF